MEPFSKASFLFVVGMSRSTCTALLKPALWFAGCKPGPIHKTSGLSHLERDCSLVSAHFWGSRFSPSPSPTSTSPHTSVWRHAHSPVLCRSLSQWGSAGTQLSFPGYPHALPTVALLFLQKEIQTYIFHLKMSILICNKCV